jgi:hypothetical protein
MKLEEFEEEIKLLQESMKEMEIQKAKVKILKHFICL